MIESMEKSEDKATHKKPFIRKDLRLYIFVILLFTGLLITFNYFYSMPQLGFPLWYNIVAVVGSVVAVITLDGIIASVTHKIQNKLNPFSKFFIVTKGQKSFYSALGVRRFKNYLPDLGTLVKFPKGKIVEPGSLEYINKYIYESCAGELGHLIGAVAGFAIIFILPLKYVFVFGLPIAIVNFILCLLPVIALRYNRYALYLLHKKLSKSAE